MEIHQIRYFLAVSRTLNFTRAAEECHVSQPALTRAVQALEAELGGELICRERRTSHLTELGKRMLPLLQRCFDSAMSAKDLARAAADPEAAPLRLALSHTVALDRLMAPIAAMFATFPRAHLRLIHGDGGEVLAALKSGEADLAVAGPLAEDWDRLDSWRLWEDRYQCAVPASTTSNRLSAEDLAAQGLVAQAHCEQRAAVEAWFASRGVQPRMHQVVTQAQVIAFVEAGLGYALTPTSCPTPPSVRTLPVEDLDITRTVHVFAVAGRQRAAPANALLALLRAGMWDELAAA